MSDKSTEDSYLSWLVFAIGYLLSFLPMIIIIMTPWLILRGVVGRMGTDPSHAAIAIVVGCALCFLIEIRPSNLLLRLLNNVRVVFQRALRL